MPAEVALDLVQAAEQRDDPALVAALAARTRRRAAAGTAAAWLDSLYGGDVARGRELFMASAELACLRCQNGGEDDDGSLGGRVGPDLRGVAAIQQPWKPVGMWRGISTCATGPVPRSRASKMSSVWRCSTTFHWKAMT